MSNDKTEKKYYYTLNRMISWKNVSVEGFDIDADSKFGIGFLPVFDDIEELVKKWPDSSFLVVATGEDTPEK